MTDYKSFVLEKVMTKSPRLDQFADLLLQGLTTAQIADRMSCTPKDARVHLARLRKRLGWQAV
jgi:DNA-binding CsgD family transcriptional regulator